MTWGAGQKVALQRELNNQQERGGLENIIRTLSIFLRSLGAASDNF